MRNGLGHNWTLPFLSTRIWECSKCRAQTVSRIRFDPKGLPRKINPRHNRKVEVLVEVQDGQLIYKLSCEEFQVFKVMDS